jgi:hypothetical protein
LDQLGEPPASEGFVVTAGPERRAAARGRGIEPEADEDVDTELVGLFGLDGVIGVVQLGDLDPAPGQPPLEGTRDGAEPAALADGDVPAPQGGRSMAQRGPGSHGGDQLGIVVAALQADELAEGRPADDAVYGEAGVALEVDEGVHGGVPEDAVDAARVETQRAQALLQLGHIVTPQHRGPAVQEAVTEPKTSLYQGIPGLRAADAVDPEATEALKSLERGPRAGAEDTIGVDGRAAGKDGGQAVLHVGDRVTTVPDGEGESYR